jgi:hypothetical protein
VGRFLGKTAAAVTVGLSLLLFLASTAVAQDAGPSSGNDSGFDFFDLRFPGSATRAMFYVMLGIIIMFAGAIIGLIFDRDRAHEESGFTRSGP